MQTGHVSCSKELLCKGVSVPFFYWVDGEFRFVLFGGVIVGKRKFIVVLSLPCFSFLLAVRDCGFFE